MLIMAAQWEERKFTGVLPRALLVCVFVPIEQNGRRGGAGHQCRTGCPKDALGRDSADSPLAKLGETHNRHQAQGLAQRALVLGEAHRQGAPRDASLR